ncbi:sulfite exporter TauE/SafE family protein [Vibrio sp. E150_011]|uniref:sulfite exporter TauE/SafE family protein n=1 Tax=Vibrio sp. 10N.261.51.F12 TaxID=3229679 RepID=UPI00354F4D2F
MDITVLLAMSLIFIGAFIQTATGFGMAIVASPLLLYLSPEYIPGPIIIVGFFIALLNTYKYRTQISLHGLMKGILGLIPGTCVGAAILYFIDVGQLSVLLGTTVLIAVGTSLLPIKMEVTPRRLMLAGFFSGFLGTSSGIGGPPMALLLQHQKVEQIRANLAAFFLMSSTLSLLIQIPIGYMSIKHLLLALPLVPAGYAGHKLAISVLHRLSKKLVRNLSLSLCLVAGIGAVYSGLKVI